MGDDGFSASELRQRNLRGGSVPDDQLRCADRLRFALPAASHACRAQPAPIPAAAAAAWRDAACEACSSPRPAEPSRSPDCGVCSCCSRSASQLRARHAEAESASPVLLIGGVLAVVVILGALYFLM